MSQAGASSSGFTLIGSAAPGRRLINSDRLLSVAAVGGAVAVLFMLAALLSVLIYNAWPSVRAFGFHFLVSSEWRANELQQPLHGPDGKVVIEDGEVVMQTLPPVFGALPVIFGTAASSALALLCAVPLSLGAALFLVRAAPRRLRPPISFMIEFLAAIPSIAYGIWAIFVLTPLLQKHIEPLLARWLGSISAFHFLFYQNVSAGKLHIDRQLPLTGRDLLGGGLVLAVMIIPIITAIARDVLQQVPRAQIEGAVALGATWWQSSKEMLKFSRSGLLGAMMLGLARAAGETMAVTMIIGNNFQISGSPFAPMYTMSSLLANEFPDASSAMQKSALCEVALVLLIMSLLFNVTARYLVVGKNSRAGASA